MPSCAIISCRARSQVPSVVKRGISFHRFPKEPEIRVKWIEVTGREDWIPTKTSTICSRHFNINDYNVKKSGNKYLKDGAIPHENVVYLHSFTNEALCSSLSTIGRRKLSITTHDADDKIEQDKIQSTAVEIEESPINAYDSKLDIKEEPIHAVMLENMDVAGTSKTTYFSTADYHFEIKEEVIDTEIKVESSPIQDELVKNNIIKKCQVKCIFCGYKYIRFGMSQTSISCSQITENAKEKLFEQAWCLQDINLLQTLIKTENIFYHENCGAKYALNYASIKKDQKEKPSSKERDVHAAYKTLSKFIQTEIYDKGETITLSDINILYRAILVENGNLEHDVEMLRNKLVNEFGDIIIKEPVHEQILYGQDVEESQATVECFHETVNETSFDKVAYEIRRAILAAEEEANLNPILLDTERDGEGVIPQQLENFITCLFNGPGKENDNSVNDIKIKEICNDIVNSVCKNKVQTHTHVKIEFDDNF